MIFIGITGGVGAGKTAVLDYLASKQGIKVMLADEIAHELMEPGTKCYEKLKNLFGNEPVWQEDGHFDRLALASVIFSDGDKRTALNNIVHPAVKEYVIEKKNTAQKDGLFMLVLEAALLIEEKYDEICDELWYIYTSKENRRKRLKASRGYSDEKIDNIFASQLTEDVYRNHCKKIIDNNGDIDNTISSIDRALSEYKEQGV